MARAFKSKVLTANRLIEGDVIYYAPGGGWVGDHRDALLIEDEAEGNALLAEANKLGTFLVGAYLADAVRDADGKPVPTHFREEFRTRGPSNYRHGKQAEG
jgi:hypothetical protein